MVVEANGLEGGRPHQPMPWKRNKKKSVKRQKAIDELSKWIHILELGNKIILSEFEWLKNTSYACDMVLEIIYIFHCIWSWSHA